MPMLSLSDRPLHTDPAIGTVPIVIRSCAKVTVVTVDTPSLQEPSSAALADRLIALADGDGAGCERQAVSLERVEEAGVDALNALLRAHLALSVLGGGLVVFGAPRTLSTAIEAAGLSGVLLEAASERAAVEMLTPKRSSARPLARAA